MASEALLLWGVVFSSIGLGFFIYGKNNTEQYRYFQVWL